MPDMERVPQERIGPRVSRSDVEEGETYVFEWSPYGWARENEGAEGRVKVTVDKVSDLVGDIEMTEAASGQYLNDLGEGRSQVMGRADNTEGVPDVTDTGIGGRYYEYAPAEEEIETGSPLGGEMGPLPGGVAERMTGGSSNGNSNGNASGY